MVLGGVALLGFGRIGFAVGLNFYLSNIDLTVFDINEDRLKIASEKFGFNVECFNVAADDFSVFKQFDLVLTALPGSISYGVLRKLVDLGVDVVDVSYFPEDPWILHELATKRECRLIVDAGFAPGLSNVVVGYFHSKFGGLKSARIYVGGLSEDPSIPLGLIATWSIPDLVDEYIRPARAIINGRIAEVDPLSYTGVINIPDLGVFEFFASDGIRTMLKTFSDVSELIEFTLRYPGHLKVMKLLRDLGFLGYDSIEVNGLKINLTDFLAKILESKLVREGRDRAVMLIDAEPVFGDRRRYIMDVRYDDSLKLTAMGKTTGFTQAEIAKLILKGLVEDKGVIPPEYFGLNSELYDELTVSLRKWGIGWSELLT